MKILNENANIPNIEDIKNLDEKIRQTPQIAVYKSYAGFPVLKGGQFADKFIIEYALLTDKALYICNFCDDSLDTICEFQDNIYNLVLYNTRNNLRSTKYIFYTRTRSTIKCNKI